LIKGGTADHTVPGFCEFRANVRFATEEQLEWIRAYVKELAANNRIVGCTCEIRESSFRVAMEYTEQNAALADAMNDIFKANGLPILKPSKRTGGSDAADVTACGIPCVDSIGVTGSKIHTPNEYAEIASLARAAKRIAAVAMELD
jgi:glutamate carboxypeptidase